MRFGLAAAVLLAVACASPAFADGPGTSPGVLAGGGGIASPRESIRYVTIPDLETTLLETVRVRGGAIARYVSLYGRYGVPVVTFRGDVGGLTRNGRILVLSEADVARELRTESRFRIVSTRRLRVLQKITLRGDFSFDAVSPRGARLFLIEHTSARDLSRYRVRVYDLLGRRLLPDVIADRTEWETGMRGYPYARATGPSGRWVYTLYGGVMGGKAFVHALDTQHAEAVCLDLPNVSADDLSTLRMHLSVNGRRLTISRQDGTRIATFRTPPHGGSDGAPARSNRLTAASVAAASGVVLFFGMAGAVRRRRR